MATATDIQGVVFKNGTATLLARIVGSDAAAINQADIDSIAYSVYQLDESDPNAATVIPGHDNVSLSVSDVVFNTLQVDARWTIDSVGYNFRHEIDVSTSPAFTVAGPYFQVRYELTPIVGQVVVARFKLRVI